MLEAQGVSVAIGGRPVLEVCYMIGIMTVLGPERMWEDHTALLEACF